ncbi:hypothetical protein C5167_045478 [Papaver somniferum]|uniref:RING-type domain-containing protein n=1 Tax=Papaver somniferum TaxID=3469 RepID=A0A4Y7LDJ0_PAPSO|nr:RING-H2 finger protein ATL70-like [Papaver somniferum]RZC82690.1 hypothetical protein C5167_045478 [Papaver somniferum]
MNSTDLNSGGGLLTEKIGGFGYGVAVSVGILFLITTITLASYFCTRGNNISSQDGHHQNPNTHFYPHHTIHIIDNTNAQNHEVGLDETTLSTYPKLLYSQAKKHLHNHHKDTSTNSCCSICLADYKPNDMLRLLPDCNHLFHLKCVDPWLKLHPTCPVCRTTPVPSPMSSPMATPLAEVAPLSMHRV